MHSDSQNLKSLINKKKLDFWTEIRRKDLDNLI